MDAPLPGTTVFDSLLSDPRVWHRIAEENPQAVLAELLDFAAG